MIIITSTEVWDNYVTHNFARFNLLFITGFDILQIVVDGLIKINTIILSIFVNSPRQPDIRIGVNEYFTIHVL